MIRLLRSNGNAQEVPDAIGAVVRNGLVYCYTAEGKVIARFPASTVVAYGRSPSLKTFAEVQRRDALRAALLARAAGEVTTGPAPSDAAQFAPRRRRRNPTRALV